jgi:hypothetical protein
MLKLRETRFQIHFTYIQTRVTTFTTAEMFQNRLSEVFGSHPWSREVAAQMRVLLEVDLTEGLKYTYQT